MEVLCLVFEDWYWVLFGFVVDNFLFFIDFVLFEVLVKLRCGVECCVIYFVLGILVVWLIFLRMYIGGDWYMVLYIVFGEIGVSDWIFGLVLFIDFYIIIVVEFGWIVIWDVLF